MTVLMSALAVVAGGFLSRETATLARQLIEAKLGKPRLVRETSRANHSFAVSLALLPFQIGIKSYLVIFNRVCALHRYSDKTKNKQKTCLCFFIESMCFYDDI